MANTNTDTCAAKLGEPGPSGMRVCGRPARYVLAADAQNEGIGIHEGWYHTDPADDDDHWPVPERYIR